MSHTFRCFARARPYTNNATTVHLFKSPSSAHQHCYYYSTRPKMSAATTAAASATDLLHTHGATIAKGIAVAGVSGVLISKFMMTSADAEAPTTGADAAMMNKQEGVSGKKVFGRPGPVFQSLALQSTEDVNHNTKRLRFKLPGDADVSGLPLTCKPLPPPFLFPSYTFEFFSTTYMKKKKKKDEMR